MLANSIVHVMSTSGELHYGVVILGAVILLCDIWFVLFHHPREHA
jgi:hypothetical protein